MTVPHRLGNSAVDFRVDILQPIKGMSRSFNLSSQVAGILYLVDFGAHHLLHGQTTDTVCPFHGHCLFSAIEGLVPNMNFESIRRDDPRKAVKSRQLVNYPLWVEIQSGTHITTLTMLFADQSYILTSICWPILC